MRNNIFPTIVILYVLFIFLICLAPFIDFASLNNPWDYARITDVDYTAKVLDEPDKRW